MFKNVVQASCDITLLRSMWGSAVLGEFYCGSKSTHDSCAVVSDWVMV